MRFRVTSLADEAPATTVQVPMAEGPPVVSLQVPMAGPQEPPRAATQAPRGSASEGRASVTARPSAGARGSVTTRPPAPDPTSLVSTPFAQGPGKGHMADTSQLSMQSFDIAGEDVAGKQGTFTGVYLPTCETMWVCACVRALIFNVRIRNSAYHRLIRADAETRN